MSDMVTTGPAGVPNNPFARAAPEHISAGAVAIEQTLEKALGTFRLGAVVFQVGQLQQQANRPG